MITRTSGFGTSDGKWFATLPEAQEHEIAALFGEDKEQAGATASAHWIIVNAQELIKILTEDPAEPAKPNRRYTRKPKEQAPV